MKNKINILLILGATVLFSLHCSPTNDTPDLYPDLKIGLVADPQYENIDIAGTRHYRESPGKLRSAIDTFNMYGVDLVQTLGDVINGKWESFDSILPVYKNLGTIKSYHLLGNHEFAVEEQFLPELLSKLDMKNFYYSYSLKGWRFIVLDGTDYMKASLKLHPEYSPEKLDEYRAMAKSNNNYEWNGAIGIEQQKWLSLQLDSAQKMNEKVILFCHMPVKSILISSGNLLNDYEILPIIESYDCVKAFINGHFHEGGVSGMGKIKFITIKGMVETTVNSFAILEIYQNQIKINGFGNQGDFVFEFD